MKITTRSHAPRGNAIPRRSCVEEAITNIEFNVYANGRRASRNCDPTRSVGTSRGRAEQPQAEVKR
jgi:hypothetical protein